MAPEVYLTSNFQSSAAPKDGCDTSKQQEAAREAKTFNPQPPRRTAATTSSPREAKLSPPPSTFFQSSAAPKDGCDPNVMTDTPTWTPLSILSRPEGRLRLRGTGQQGRLPPLFQSSAAPKDGCDAKASR